MFVSFRTCSNNCKFVIFKMSNEDATTIVGKTETVPVPGRVAETVNDQTY